ncbi:dihydropteroate synthase [Maribrevibacterium harenarium]|uniref:Dihydropteroate synthase n=1 Tax=Maribrevibacterium harenarium TaxID=2589817 RepID=A0A501X3L3_9GAMM|nr:dihydropteroate synthase [Maribrevibacterium harenarium]TPE55007.1 dihydropteroate synthase [Maribrevibacterium harenarium]
MSVIQFGQKSLDFCRPFVMGILNVTPDSFSDGGRHNTFEQALRHAEQMVSDGAAFIDVGGESTRPGAAPVSLQEEMDRVLPVVEALNDRVDTIISVDTSSPEVMLEAARLGAGLINDVRALERPGALAAAAATGLPVCLMHMQGTPVDMQESPSYSALLDEVLSYLMGRTEAAMVAGINKQQIILDPGIGFGKTLEHNLSLLNQTQALCELGHEVLIGVSRKTMIGQVLNANVDERLYGTMGANAATYLKGARIFRVHDVKPHVQMLELMYRIESES